MKFWRKLILGIPGKLLIIKLIILKLVIIKFSLISTDVLK